MRFVDRMHAKGWTVDEIHHALGKFAQAHERNHPAVNFLERISYWLYLCIIIITIAVCSLAFYPFFSLFPAVMQPLAFLTIGLVSASFGLLFAHVLHHIDELGHHHHALVVLVAVSCAVLAGWYFSGAHLLSYGITFALCFSTMYSLYWSHQ